ncbi:MAG: hypothetical protein N3A54_03690 [Patescibacteria group bacterium]|nr:hypothetical protein [Patescibacteria group bacterium]
MSEHTAKAAVNPIYIESPFLQRSFALNENGGIFISLLKSFLWVISSVCFYIVLSQLVRPFISFMKSILFAIHPLVLPWERVILTESFSISFLIFYICAFFYFFKHPTMIRGLFVVGLAVLLTWLRSVYVALLPFTLLLFFLHKRQVKIFPQIYLLCGIFFIPILFHMFVNYRYHNMFTLQVMGPINMFGRLLVHPYPIPDIPDNRISEWMKANYVPDTYKNPFPILESLSKDVYFYFDIDLLHDIRVYNATVIRQNIVPFLIDVARDIPKAYEVNSSIRLSNIRSVFLFQQFSVAFMVFFFRSICISLYRHQIYPSLINIALFNSFFQDSFLLFFYF